MGAGATVAGAFSAGRCAAGLRWRKLTTAGRPAEPFFRPFPFTAARAVPRFVAPLGSNVTGT